MRCRDVTPQPLFIKGMKTILSFLHFDVLELFLFSVVRSIFLIELQISYSFYMERFFSFVSCFLPRVTM